MSTSDSIQATPQRGSHSRGLALVEILVCLVIISCTVALAMPFFRSDGQAALFAAAERISADIGYAQAASMGDPENPASIYFNASGYTVTTPDQVYSVAFSESDFGQASGVVIECSNMDTGFIQFNHYGAVDADPLSDAPQILLTAPTGHQMALTIATSTGTIGREWLDGGS